MMILSIEISDEFPCFVTHFTVNNIEADIEDFGRQTYKLDTSNNICENMIFIYHLPNHVVLTKYEIDEVEYFEICRKLKDVLNIGTCNICYKKYLMRC